MYTKAKTFLLHAVSAVHAGSGSEIGLVDLPIQREKHTGFPKIESSSLKGAIRYTVQNSIAESELDHFEKVFGSSPDRGNEKETQASAIAFSDARLLLFPVKSMRGIFAWVTCPLILRRFNNDLKQNQSAVKELPIPEANSVSSDKLMVSKDKVILEEYAFDVKISDKAGQLEEELKAFVQSHLFIEMSGKVVVLSDDDFSDFARLSTEVNARIKIDVEFGTADGGALWYEENVPPETIFYSHLYSGHVRGKSADGMTTADDVEAFLMDEHHFPGVFQLGGNSTLGRGMLRKIWL